mmetsp:Transcript_12019/g.19431  ORF Transcript_12019/g.19431 Transcript_12019/m.19431 type:complete len:588 (-) Transcript_12019:132-1895(-)
MLGAYLRRTLRAFFWWIGFYPGQTLLTTLDDFLNDIKHAPAKSLASLRFILDLNCSTEFGRKYDFASIKDSAEYRKRVPLSMYDDYKQYIDRILSEDSHTVLSALPVSFIAVTGGTTGEELKRLPKSSAMQINPLWAETIYKRDAESINPQREAYARGGNALGFMILPHRKIRGKWLEGAAAGAYFRMFAEKVPSLWKKYASPKEVLLGGPKLKWDAAIYVHLLFGLHTSKIRIIQAMFVNQMCDAFNMLLERGTELANDVETGSICSAVDVPPELRILLVGKYLRPNPGRAEEIRKELIAGPEGIIGRLWPGVTHAAANASGSFKAYVPRVKRLLGPEIHFHSPFYVASEAQMGISLTVGADEYCLVPTGTYYEFIPFDDHIIETGADTPTVEMDQLEAGKEYEIVVTTVDGLYRYRMLDIIRIVRLENGCPFFQLLGRRTGFLLAPGVWLTDALLNSAMLDATFGNAIVFTSTPDTNSSETRLLVFIERDKDEDQMKVLPSSFDRSLCRLSVPFLRVRESKAVAEPKVIYVKFGTFASIHRMRSSLKTKASGFSELTMDMQIKVPAFVMDTESISLLQSAAIEPF